jgi:hypothetical protein
MVQVDRVYEPETADKAMMDELYLSLVEALDNRGWLPSETAAHARSRAGR